jgi:hypothetical protein
MINKQETACKIVTTECDKVVGMMRFSVLCPNFKQIMTLSFYDVEGADDYFQEIQLYRDAMGLAHTVTKPLRLDGSETSLALAGVCGSDFHLVSNSQVASGAEGHPLYCITLDGVDILALKSKIKDDWIVYSVDAAQIPLYTPHSLSGPELLSIGEFMVWRLYIADQPVLQHSMPYNGEDWQFLSGLKSNGSTRVSAVINMHGWIDLTIGMTTRRFNMAAITQSGDGCYVSDYTLIKE